MEAIGRTRQVIEHEVPTVGRQTGLDGGAADMALTATTAWQLD